MVSVFVQAHSSSFIDVYLDAACSAEDMYRVIFHPQMVSVCEKVNYAVPQFAWLNPVEVKLIGCNLEDLKL